MAEKNLNEMSSVNSKQLDSLSVDWGLANLDAAEWVRTYGFDLVNSITGTTVTQLQKEIAAFIENSETMPQLIARLEPLFGPVQAELIATTEVTRAYAQGNMAAWRKSGTINKRRWNTANDDLVCPICGPLAGQIVGLDEPFPGGVDAPPAHPRCRCWLTPITDYVAETELRLMKERKEQETAQEQGRGGSGEQRPGWLARLFGR